MTFEWLERRELLTALPFADTGPVQAVQASDFTLDRSLLDTLTRYYGTIPADASLRELTRVDAETWRLKIEFLTPVDSVSFHLLTIKNHEGGPYIQEVQELAVSGSPLHTTAFDAQSNRVIEYWFRYHSDQTTVRETTTLSYQNNAVRYRLNKVYDPQGALRQFTFDTYQVGGTSLFSHAEWTYDSSGNTLRYDVWTYNSDGSPRRSTTETYFPLGPVHKSTDIRHYSDGQIIARTVRYYDTQFRQVGLVAYEYVNGSAVKITSTRYDESGSVISQYVVSSPLPAPQVSQPAPDSSDVSYLEQFYEAYQQTLSTLRSSYQDVLRMNWIPAQLRLEQLTSNLRLTSSQANRYRNLNLYYSVVKDLAAAIRNEDLSAVYRNYPSAVDAASGDWKPWFYDFAAQEGLQLPLAPLRVVDTPSDLSPDEAAALTTSFRKFAESDPAAFFDGVRRHAAGQSERILESMRKVKALIKVLEYRAQDTIPVFGWLAFENQPDLTELGVRPITVLTFWHFFPMDKQGRYLSDEPNEDIIRQRVPEYMSNEDMLYVIDLEHWQLEGDPATVEDSIRKLKQAADWIHKYNPNLLIGFYLLLPRRDPNSAYLGTDSAQYRAWQEHNDRIAAGLEDSVDILFPSLYTLHLGKDNQTTEQRWEIFATESIREARRIADGKPVIPFLALYYHPNGYGDDRRYPLNLKGWTWVEPELLLFQMSRLYNLADGVVLYNDLNADWRLFERTGIPEAITKFSTLRSQKRLDAFRAYYDRLVTQYHDQLVEKLEAEKVLQQLLIDQRAALSVNNSILASQLGRSIVVWQQRIARMIDLWGYLRTF